VETRTAYNLVKEKRVDVVIQNVIKANLSDDDAAKVIAALEAVAVERGVGTVLHNPATGDVALRVRQYAETYWRVYSTDDRTWIETTNLAGWGVLHTSENNALKV
jgi:hypothetical protein